MTTDEDDLKEHLLIDLHKLLVPFIDIRSLLARVRVVIAGFFGVRLVLRAPLDDFLEHCLVHLRRTLDPPSSKAVQGSIIRTFGIGMVSVPTESPISSIMFLIKMDRSAMERSETRDM